MTETTPDVQEQVARLVHKALYGSDIMWRESLDLSRQICEALYEPDDFKITKATEALEFYAKAWVDEFSFLGTEPTGKEPSDALIADEGNRARSVLKLLL